MNQHLIFVRHFPFKPGLEEMLLADLIRIVDASRQWPGCLSFDLYRITKSPSSLVLQETWESHDTYQAFCNGPLNGELVGMASTALLRPMESWQVEEVR